MSTPLFSDRRAASLLDRVRADVSHLRDDISTLLIHAKRETLPNGARELADQAKQQLAAGSAYAASRLRGLRPPPSQSASWVGGAVVAGLVAYGVYALCRKNGCCIHQSENPEEFDPERDNPG